MDDHRRSWQLSEPNAKIVSFQALQEPGLTRVRVLVRQGEIECEAEALITVTQELLPETAKISGSKQGLPAYTFEHRPGELWRSRFDQDRNLIIINNAHRDFVYVARNRMLKLRYLCRLRLRELVYNNFPGLFCSQNILEDRPILPLRNPTVELRDRAPFFEPSAEANSWVSWPLPMLRAKGAQP